MTKTDELLREFEKMWTPKKRGKGPSTFPQHLHALISEHYYPKEFTRWFRSEDFWDIFEESTDDIGITSWEYLPSGQVLYGLDEILNYWKENEQ